MARDIRVLVRGVYDTQKLRIQIGNRIVMNFKAKLGQEPSTPEEDMEKEGKEILAIIRKNFEMMTEGVLALPPLKQFKGNEIISSYTELVLISQYVDLEKAETKHFKMLERVLQEYKIYTEFLEKVKGVGPAMAGVIISEIDIHKARHASSIWKYAGLDVAPDGRGRSKKAEHLIDFAYVDKDGKEATRKSITFNPFLKTKLVGVLASSFLRCGKDNKYAQVYYNTKNRLENHAVYGVSTETSKLHRHNMAMRKMVKMFLVDLYTNWRTIEGLPVSLPYSEAKLGLIHGGSTQVSSPS